MTIEHHRSIVVIGAMNPAIHHPAWYCIVSAISEGELEYALSQQVVCTRTLAQFTSPHFTIICLPERWQITCGDESSTRILEAAKATFAALEHTPVTAYGVNHDFHAETPVQVAAKLAAIVRRTPFAFSDAPDTEGSLTYIVKSESRIDKTTVAASPRGPNYVQVLNNGHYPAPRDKVKHFDLGALLEEAITMNNSLADANLSRVLGALKE